MRRQRPREVEPLAQNHTAGVSGGTKVHPSLSPWYSASLGTWSISIFCTPSRAPVSTRVQFQKWSCWVKGYAGLNCDRSARYFTERLHTSRNGWSCSGLPQARPACNCPKVTASSCFSPRCNEEWTGSWPSAPDPQHVLPEPVGCVF